MTLTEIEKLAEEVEGTKIAEATLALCKLVKVQREALEWCAGTICMDDIYKHENNEQNKINLLRNIREAHAALAAGDALGVGIK